MHRTELEMVIATTRKGRDKPRLAGAERVRAWKGWTQRGVVDLRGTENSVHEDDESVPADEELLEGAGGVDDHGEFLQVHSLQS